MPAVVLGEWAFIVFSVKHDVEIAHFILCVGPGMCVCVCVCVCMCVCETE